MSVAGVCSCVITCVFVYAEGLFFRTLNAILRSLTLLLQPEPEVMQHNPKHDLDRCLQDVSSD